MREMLTRRVDRSAGVWQYFADIESQLYRYPAIDPDRFGARSKRCSEGARTRWYADILPSPARWLRRPRWRRSPPLAESNPSLKIVLERSPRT